MGFYAIVAGYEADYVSYCIGDDNSLSTQPYYPEEVTRYDMPDLLG